MIFFTSNKTKLISTVGFFSLMTCVSCANSNHKTAEVDQPRTSYTNESESQALSGSVARDVEAHSFVEITFEPGSANLTENSKKSLNSVMAQANRQGKIDEIMVMSWSDEEYPSDNIKRLPKPQRDLASRRNKAVEKYVKSIRKVDVDLYNMAEQPGVLSKWFNTTDNKLKNSLIAAGLPTTADDPQYPSKASHSVVLVKIE